MSQLSAKLRKMEGGHGHWCPGCGEMHMIPDSWEFDGNVDRPTFNPSVKITGAYDRRGSDWKAVPGGYCCHYFLHAGVLKYQGDSTHDFAGKEVPLPDLPSGFTSE